MNNRSNLQYRKDLVKLLKMNEKNGGQSIPDWYKNEILTTKSIQSVIKEVKRIENKNKKLMRLKENIKPRTFDELAKQYKKLELASSGRPESHINSDINIFYKNKKKELEKKVLSLEDKLSKKIKKDNKLKKGGNLKKNKSKKVKKTRRLNRNKRQVSKRNKKL